MREHTHVPRSRIPRPSLISESAKLWQCFLARGQNGNDMSNGSHVWVLYTLFWEVKSGSELLIFLERYMHSLRFHILIMHRQATDLDTSFAHASDNATPSVSFRCIFSPYRPLVIIGNASHSIYLNSSFSSHLPLILVPLPFFSVATCCNMALNSSLC
jgi:hypothetical protein